jgi:hypothetical protein
MLLILQAARVLANHRRRHDWKMQLRRRKNQAASSLLGTDRVDRTESQSKTQSLLVGYRGLMPRRIPSASGRGASISLDISLYRTNVSQAQSCLGGQKGCAPLWPHMQSVPQQRMCGLQSRRRRT